MKSREQNQGTEQADWSTDPRLFAELVDKAMKEAVKEAIAEHHRAGHPVPIGQNGRVVWLYPDGSIRETRELLPSENGGS